MNDSRNHYWTFAKPPRQLSQGQGRIPTRCKGVSFTLGRERLGIVGRIRLRQIDDRPGAC